MKKQKSDDSLALSKISWIEWHCMVEGHEFLTEIDT